MWSKLVEAPTICFVNKYVRLVDALLGQSVEPSLLTGWRRNRGSHQIPILVDIYEFTVSQDADGHLAPIRLVTAAVLLARFRGKAKAPKPSLTWGFGA